MSDDLNQNLSQEGAMVANDQTAELSPAEQQEKMLRQSEVNELVGRVRSEASEKGYKKALEELQNKQQSQTSNSHDAQRASQGALSEEQVRAMIQEQALQYQQEQAQKMMAERIVSEFSSKMQSGAEKYEDFEESVRNLDLRTIPEIVQLANSVGNTDDVMYDLAKNPYKIANLKTLAATSPHLARAEMNRLSQSITSNQKAKDQVSGIKEPLSKMKPSTGAVDTGEMSVRDFKNQPWLRR